MTADVVLVLASLLLAHLVADFVLQTDRMVRDKTSATRRHAWRGLLRHGAAVALCHLPAAAIWGVRGLALMSVVTVTHVLIDRWKVRATRRAEARALGAAHRHADTVDGDSLGPAWTPAPAALFLLDQAIHVAVSFGAWAVLIRGTAYLPEWTALVDPVVSRVDDAELQRWTLAAVVLGSLLIVNVRAGALFVATLVRPRDVVTGVAHPSHPRPAVDAPGTPTAPPPTRWRLRLGPIEAVAEPTPVAPAAATAVRPGAQDGHAPAARIGATIGILERLLIVTFVLTGSTAAIGFVVAAKTLARFKQLDDRDFAEYYLLGTLASVAVALLSALVAQAALGTLPAG